MVTNALHAVVDVGADGPTCAPPSGAAAGGRRFLDIMIYVLPISPFSMPLRASTNMHAMERKCRNKILIQSECLLGLRFFPFSFLLKVVSSAFTGTKHNDIATT
jgi:hypothetical protein